MSQIETALEALADIATAKDMTLAIAQNKAQRVYDELTNARRSQMVPTGETPRSVGIFHIPRVGAPDDGSDDIALVRESDYRTLERELAESQMNEADAWMAQSHAATERDQALSDAARFRWLTDDHDDPLSRERCRALLERMPSMSYSAVSAAIDAARKEGQ